MDFYDMGPAMAISHNEREAKEAKKAALDAHNEIEALKARVEKLEKALARFKFIPEL